MRNEKFFKRELRTKNLLYKLNLWLDTFPGMKKMEFLNLIFFWILIKMQIFNLQAIRINWQTEILKLATDN